MKNHQMSPSSKTVLFIPPSTRILNFFRRVREEWPNSKITIVCPEKISPTIDHAAKYYFDSYIIYATSSDNDKWWSRTQDSDVFDIQFANAVALSRPNVDGEKPDKVIHKCSAQNKYVCPDKFWNLAMIRINRLTYTFRKCLRMFVKLQKQLKSRIQIVINCMTL